MYVAARDKHALTVLYSVQFCGFYSQCLAFSFLHCLQSKQNGGLLCETNACWRLVQCSHTPWTSARECNHVLAAVWLSGCTPKTHPSARRWQHLPNKISQIVLQFAKRPIYVTASFLFPLAVLPLRTLTFFIIHIASQLPSQPQLLFSRYWYD